MPALGSHLADNLARQGFRQLRVIDRDRVEEHNVGTQLYGESDVGAWKVEVLRQRLFRATGVEIDAVRKELSDRTARTLLQNGGLVVDTFDNSTSRRLVQEHCRTLGLPCLHVGLYSDYGEVIWDERYRVPAMWPAMFATTHWPAIWYCWLSLSPRRHWSGSRCRAYGTIAR